MTNTLSGWAAIIAEEGRKSRKRTRFVTNTQCTRCCVLPLEIIFVGPIPFCRRCCYSQFGNILRFEPKSLEYKLWHQEWLNRI